MEFHLIMRPVKIGLLLFNFLSAKHYLVEVEEKAEAEAEDKASDYSLGHDSDLLHQKLKQM